MYRHKRSPACWTAVIGLVVALTLEPVLIYAQTNQRYNVSVHSSSPIGMIKSNGQVKINGRLAEAEQLVWNGDFLETASGGNSQVLIDSIGQLNLMSNARVRLSLNSNSLDDKANHLVLVAALLSGDLAVRLNEDASAYIEACGRVFTSSDGAIFRIRIREGNPFVESERGLVESAPKYFDFEFTAEPLYLSRQTRVPRPAQAQLSVNRRQRLQLALRVKQRQKTRVTSMVQGLSTVGNFAIPQTQDDWKPAAGKVVRFRLTLPIGTLNGQTDQVFATTDPTGIATVTFVGESKGVTQVKGNVITGPGETCTPEEVSWDIKVSGPGFFRSRNLIIMGAAAAIATIATYPIWKSKKDTKPIPPPEIIP